MRRWLFFVFALSGATALGQTHPDGAALNTTRGVWRGADIRADHVVDKSAPGTAVVQSSGQYIYRAGDADGFGYGAGWRPPLECDTFDNRGPEDLGVFDQRRPGSAYNSICNFVGTWSNPVTPPPGGTGQLTVGMYILGGQTATAYCFASPCSCATPTEDLLINGVSQSDFLSYVGCAETTWWTKTYQGPAAAAMASAGAVNFQVNWGNNPLAIDYSEIQVLPSMEVSVYSGDNQKGVIGSPVEQKLAVKLTSPDPNFNPQQVAAVTFEIVSFPSQATGFGLGADESAISSTYSTVADENGIVRATLVLGDKEGTYAVRVKSSLSLTGKTADFTATAKKPASVAILRETPDLTDRAPAYAISSTQPTVFYMVGLDAQNQKIGPIKSNWSTSASGPGATRGAGTINPTTATTTTTFTPTQKGKLAISANPVVSGITTARADLYLTALYVSVDNSFDPASPADQSARFIPGSYLNGDDVALDVMEQTGQGIVLRVLTGAGSKGKATFSVASSAYPGIAMNYPSSGGSTAPDMALLDPVTNLATPSVSSTFSPDGDTRATLLVRDYGAAGTINVTITSGRTTYALKGLRLPVDVDSNSLPDAGWKTGPAGGLVTASGLTAGGDVDDPISASNTSVGDGLSNYEEYRGFVLGGKHIRTDPHEKDVFLDIDPEILVEMDAIPVISTLPVHFRYADPNEVTGTTVTNRFERNRPIINPNRLGIPGARSSGKRAVRIVYQNNHPPILRDPLTNRVFEAWRVGYLGITIPDEFADLYTLNSTSNSQAIHSPDHVQVVELYPRGFNRALHTDFTGFYVDDAGNPVPDCATVSFGTPCDYYDPANNLILPFVESVPGLNARSIVLHTVIDPSRYPSLDWYTKAESLTCSGGVVSETTQGLSVAEMSRLRKAYVGHELGHALHMSHQALCGNIMYDTYPASPRVTMADVLPIPIIYGTINLDEIVLTEP